MSRVNVPRRVILSAAMVVFAAWNVGCLERRISITSEPPGAAVVVNDVELGRTPLEADFTYYGVHDVRVYKEGYEPLRTTARASTPIWEYAPIDLVVGALPVTIEKRVPWNFTLEPAIETTRTPDELNTEVIARAKVLREQLK
jgi:hypothetical protein